MSDILIRGIELPSKGCLRCPFNLYYANAVYCNCMIIKLLGKPSEAKYPNEVNCPLRELPEHGDLVDREWLKEMAYSKVEDFGGAFLDTIDMAIAPVIVPSNKEDIK